MAKRPAIGINAFFAKRLNAPVYNPRWSWGAYDPSTETVSLRVWRDEMHDVHGRPAIRIKDPIDPAVKRSNTRISAENERAKHVELAREGRRLIGVVCKSLDPGGRARKIESYETDRFAELKGLVDRDSSTWAFIDRWATAGEVDQRLAAWSDAASDIDAVRRDPKLTDTVRQSLIEARLGQGGFRERVLAHWGRACALTGCSFDPLLRASHIKPWRHSDNDERLSVRNGLPLAAHVDVLFDRGFITFTDDGELLASKSLPEEARALFGGHVRLRAALDTQQKAFLAHHRVELFRSG
jgi:putative restriction endonuclease